MKIPEEWGFENEDEFRRFLRRNRPTVQPPRAGAGITWNTTRRPR
jgi:hypothetical protein